MMSKFLLIVVVSVLSVLTACATKTGPVKKLYTQQERAKMSYCMGTSSTIRSVAIKKLKGMPKEEVKQLYVDAEYAKVKLTAVDKVYAEEFTYPWDYTIKFFEECANTIADVPVYRVNLARHCASKSLIAGVAHSYKAANHPKKNAYNHFSKFTSASVNQVIDKVYASPKSYPEIRLEIWNTCMSPLSESK